MIPKTWLSDLYEDVFHQEIIILPAGEMLEQHLSPDMLSFRSDQTGKALAGTQHNPSIHLSVLLPVSQSLTHSLTVSE